MSLQDHYQVLNVPISATTEEIKKAFRKLALKYHPDKNTEPAASRKYAEIQEAYLTLKDKTTRVAYNYKRYQQDPKKNVKSLARTPEEILQLSIALKKKITMLDPYRIDLDLLGFEVQDLLSAHNLVILQENEDPVINTKFVLNVLDSARLLPLDSIKNIAGILETITDSNGSIKKALHSFLRQIKMQYYWDRYKIWFALAAAVLFCILLLFFGK